MSLRSLAPLAGLLASAACAPAPAKPAAPPPAPSAAPAATPTPATSAAGYDGFGASSLSPELLARFAPTPIPSELSRRIQAMYDVRAPGAGLLAPDGKTLYFEWNVTGTSQVFRLDAPRAFPVQLTGGEDQTSVRAVTRDGKWLVLQRDRKGEEHPGIYLQPAAGGPLAIVIHAAKVQASFQGLSRDGKTLYYTANDVRPDSRAVYAYDLATRKTTLVYGEKGLWSISDQQPGGRLLLSKATGALTREYYEYDPATQKLTALLGQGEREEYDAEYGRAPGELIVRTSKLGDFRRLYRYKIADKKLEPITPDVEMDVEGFYLDEAKSRIFYSLNDGGYSRPKVIDATTFAERRLPLPKDAEQVRFGQTTPDGRYTTLLVGTPQSPAQGYVYDAQTSRLEAWTAASVPEVVTSRFAKASLEFYPARDGTKIPMFVRRPASCDGPCPVLVLFHGGPEGQARPGFSPSAQLYVDAGYVLVEPNVRGSDGYGKAWLAADDGPKRLSVITDIADCGKYVREHFAVNGVAPKVGVFGGSYGGYATLMAMTRFAGTYDAGVAIVGMSNLETFLANTAPYRRQLRISEYGDPVADKQALQELSPITHLDKLTGPVLLIQGATDPRVPVGEAVQLHQALEQRGQATKMVIFPDEGHGAKKRENRVLQAGYILDFFDRELAE